MFQTIIVGIYVKFLGFSWIHHDAPTWQEVQVKQIPVFWGQRIGIWMLEVRINGDRMNQWVSYKGLLTIGFP